MHYFSMESIHSIKIEHIDFDEKKIKLLLCPFDQVYYSGSKLVYEHFSQPTNPFMFNNLRDNFLF